MAAALQMEKQAYYYVCVLNAMPLRIHTVDELEYLLLSRPGRVHLDMP